MINYLEYKTNPILVADGVLEDIQGYDEKTRKEVVFMWLMDVIKKLEYGEKIWSLADENSKEMVIINNTLTAVGFPQLTLPDGAITNIKHMLYDEVGSKWDDIAEDIYAQLDDYMDEYYEKNCPDPLENAVREVEK